jgi:hypothetical protein
MALDRADDAGPVIELDIDGIGDVRPGIDAARSPLSEQPIDTTFDIAQLVIAQAAGGEGTERTGVALPFGVAMAGEPSRNELVAQRPVLQRLELGRQVVRRDAVVTGEMQPEAPTQKCFYRA